MQSLADLVSMQSFGCHPSPQNYANSSGLSQSADMLSQTMADNKSINSLPVIASNLGQSQWILNPFCSPPLMTTAVVTPGNPTANTSEMASILATNYLLSNNINHLVPLSLPSMDTQLSSSSSLNKEVLRFPTCCIYAPKASAPKATTRERPLGCRTVFVGGLPENTTEDIIKEVFGQICGKICAIRLSKKNFCHIRFESEKSVDPAIALSGHRIKINDSEDSVNTGRLHIDFAQARDDQYDWECKQRALQREMRHRERQEYDRKCPPSPPIAHFSDHEATQLIDKLKCDQSFLNAAQVLINWLDRGECQKRNSGQFYTMIQSTNNHVRRLQNERTIFENEWISARQLYNSRMQSVLVQFSEIEKVFEAAMRQKAWDHFTKAQRKHIDVWFKQAKEIKSAQVEDVLNKREEDEMDLSDGDNDIINNVNNSFSDSNDNCFAIESSETRLRDENDSLKCQIESFRNEAIFAQAESSQEKEELERQIILLQQALQGMQHQVMTLSQQNKVDRPSGQTTSQPVIPGQRALLISLISIFFNAHPYGANCDDIVAYLSQQSHIRDTEILSSHFIDSFLTEYPQLFAPLESDSSGKKLWRFCAFQVHNSH